jgi:asparagine synthetase B (glutamine-hydrolysing)
MACKLAKSTPPVPVLEEVRYPYLDQDLIEFILSVPASQLLRPGERRSLMRRSLAGTKHSAVPTAWLQMHGLPCLARQLAKHRAFRTGERAIAGQR